MRLSLIQQKRIEKATLYRIVYDAQSVKIAILLLFAFFVLQPAAHVFAAKDVGQEQETTSGEIDAGASVQEEAVEEESDSQEEDGDVLEEIEEVPEGDEEIAYEDSELSEDSTSDGEVILDSEVFVSEIDVREGSDNETSNNSTSTEVYSDQSLQTATTTEEYISENDLPLTSTSTESNFGGVSDETDVTVVGEGVSEVHVGDDNEEVHSDEVDSIENTDENGVNESDSQTQSSDGANISDESEEIEMAATTTDDLVVGAAASSTDEVVHVQSPIITDANRHQFSVDECVSVGDGSFYCNKNANVGAARAEQVVFAQLDAEGDHEIFLNNGKKLVQITDNRYDDIAPEYDALSHSIVWHRLLNGRYQIISYDIDEEIETQLTDTRTNNMEPSKEGEVTVWQRWIGDNWEIVLFDGSHERILTDNQTHDIAPDVQGGYIIWHTNDTDGKRQVVVYEIETELLSYIEDNEGGQVVNPRFVLVYDTKFENGDLITKGFNPDTGDVVALAAQPGEEPINIPDTDPVGETRALIQNKSNSRDESIEDLVPETGPTTNDLSTTTASTTEQEVAPETSDVLVDSYVGTTTTTVDENVPLTDFDLIIEPYVSTTSETTSLATGTTTSA